MPADADELGRLILEVFRLNGRLLARGDEIVGPIGLTSARWQVLGAIARPRTGRTVAQIAKEAGVARQGVQRIVNELVRDGLVEFRDNPHHKKAQLAVLTGKGDDAYGAADQLRRNWIGALAVDFQSADIAKAVDVLAALRQRL
ncbi:MarR family transcriptional regulator [Rhizobium lusitanum]|uniref:MarR family winged helix-turn-helix transcriptional regulator n=1 Tax=Rhizobium lusitanum TaxID=293958 RepID=UPI00160F7900|nr:MarR family transcriptional regulator [Rhizobium lusitanum]QND49162.1 MarR family transcriptional regulator [Rhizobium lusitanum]